jgi:hypothetical protein
VQGLAELAKLEILERTAAAKTAVIAGLFGEKGPRSFEFVGPSGGVSEFEIGEIPQRF